MNPHFFTAPFLRVPFTQKRLATVFSTNEKILPTFGIFSYFKCRNLHHFAINYDILRQFTVIYDNLR